MSASRLDRRAGFPIGLTPLDRPPLVVLLLALGEAHGHLDATVLEVQAEGNERHSFLDGFADQFADFAAVQEELSAAQRFVIGVPTMAIWADIHVVDEHFAVLDASEAVTKIDASLADRFHL